MSVFLMGCYNPANQKWCTVTKVHTGHDDKTLAGLQVGDRLCSLKDLTPMKFGREIYICEAIGPFLELCAGTCKKIALKVTTRTKSRQRIAFLRGPTSLDLAVLTQPPDSCPDNGGIVLLQIVDDIAQRACAVSVQEQEQHQLLFQG